MLVLGNPTIRDCLGGKGMRIAWNDDEAALAFR